MADVLGSAYIDVRARLTGFEQEVRGETKAAMAGAAEEVKAGNVAVADAFNGTSLAAGKSLDKVATDAEASAKRSESAFGKMKESASGFLESAGIGSWSTAAKLGIVGVAGAAIDLASKFQTATVTLANQAGISQQAAAGIGKAFLSTAGDSTFSASQMIAAFGPVAGTFRTMYGQALTASQALTVMKASMDLAEASGIPLADATALVAKNMLTFHLSVGQASTVSDVLFNTSRALGIGVDDLGSQFARLAPKLAGSGTSLAQVGGLMIVVSKEMGTGRAAVREAGLALQSLVSPSKTAQAALTEAGITTVGSNGKFVGLSSVIGQLHDKMLTLPGGAQAAAAGTALLSAKQDLASLEADKQTKSIKAQEAALQLHVKGLTIQASALSSSSLLTAVFGKQSAAMASIISGGVPALNAATAATGKSGTAQAAAKAQAGTFEGTLKTLKATASDVGVTFGQQLLPAVSALLRGILPLAKDVGSFVNLLIRYKAVVVPVVVVMASFYAGLKVAALAQEAWTKVQTVAATVAKAFGKSTSDAAVATSKQTAASTAAEGAQNDLATTLDRLAAVLDEIVGSTQTLAVEDDELAASVAAAGASLDSLIASSEAANAALLELSAGEDAAEASGGALAGVMDALDTALDANPIGLLVAAFAALVVGVIYAWTHFKAFRDVVEDVGRVLKGAFLDALHAVETAFTHTVNWIEQAGQTVFHFLETWGPVALAVLVPFIGIPLLIWQHFGLIVGWLTDIWHGIVAVFTSLWKDITRIWTSISTDVDKTITTLVTWITGVFTGLWHSIVSIFSTLWKDVTGTINLFGTDAHNAVETVLTDVEDLFTGWWHTLKTLTTTTWTDIVSTVTSIFSGVGQAVSGVWTTISGFFVSGVNSVISLLNTFIDGIDRILGDLHLGIKIGAIPLLGQAPSGPTAGPSLALAPKLATGGWIGKPTAIVGEGNPHWPEVVIPTDPAHRANALRLYEQAGTKLMSGGGFLHGITHAVEHPISTAVGAARSVAGTAAGKALDAVKAILDAGLDHLPDPFSSMGKGAATTMVSAVTDLIKGKGFATGGLAGSDGGAPNAVDTIPAWLSPGEFVVTADAVNRVGLPNLYALNGGVGNAQSLGVLGGAVPTAAGMMAAGGVPAAEAANNAAQAKARAAEARAASAKAAALAASNVAYAASHAASSASKAEKKAAEAESQRAAAESRTASQAAAADAAAASAAKAAAAKTASDLKAAQSAATKAAAAAAKQTAAITKVIADSYKSTTTTDDGESASALLIANSAASTYLGGMVNTAATDQSKYRGYEAALAPVNKQVSTLSSQAAALTSSKKRDLADAAADKKASEAKGISATAKAKDLAAMHAAQTAYNAATVGLKSTDATLDAARAKQKALTADAKGMATAYATTTKNIATAAAALATQLAPQIAAVQSNYATSVTSGSDLGSLFNTTAGYGAMSAASVIAQLRLKVQQAQQFGVILRTLAAKGLDPTLLAQIAQAGPQAGLEIATQLLSDPTAITTIDALETQLAQVSGTGTGNLSAATVAGQKVSGAAIAAAGGVAKAAAAGASLNVQGDLVVRSDADVTAIGQKLYTAALATQRATGVKK